MIDARAIIDPAAEIGEDVSVGPFSIIGAHVRIGRGTSIGPHVVICGRSHIGADNKIYQFASIGEAPQDNKYKDEDTLLEIGDRNRIREFATIHRGTVQDRGITRIGNDNLLMAYTHVAHDCCIGNNTILANAASLGGHVQIADWAILGGFSIVHQFCRLGAHCFSAMGSAIGKDVPPYVMVGGQPARPHGINVEGLRRRGFDDATIRVLKRAYKILYMHGLPFDEARDQVTEAARETPVLQLLADFLVSSERGFVR